MDENKKNSFDKLVAGLSTEDRLAMLEKINNSVSSNVEFNEIIRSPIDFELTLSERLANEGFFYRIFLWLRSIFKQKSMENLYNDDTLLRIAKKLNKEHIGLINYRQKYIDSLFYERLRSLKEASEFFKPYILILNENIGDFYVFLSSFVAPELSTSINEKADPFTLSFGQQPTVEVKDGLLKKLDEILNNISEKTKGALYSSIVQVNWMVEYTALPFIHFISQFTNVTGKSFTCPYNRASYDYNELGAVLSNIQNIDPKVLEAIFLYSRRKDLSDNSKKEEIERDLKDFMNMSNHLFVSINDFLTNIPIVELGKVITQDYNWEPGSISGVEAWFPSFRMQWRKIFDIRWNEWVKERKKKTLEKSLQRDFNLKKFPVLMYRPWSFLWTNVSFNCELTGGFLCWFAFEMYGKVIDPLNSIMLDGIFLRTENRTEYGENLNLFTQANNRMKRLISRISPEGEFGISFQEIMDIKIKTINVQNQIDKMINTIENEIREITKEFGKSCRAIERVFHGFFDEKKDGIHEGLQNINTIKGHQNREWRDNIRKIRETLKKCIYYISELEPIDSAGKNG